MKFFRIRGPSLKGLLGITKFKKSTKRSLGITTLLKPFRAPGNAVRGIKRKSGYYAVNRAIHGQLPAPLQIAHGRRGSRAGGKTGGCGALLVTGFGVWLFVRSCGSAATVQSPRASPAQVKNGRALTPEQIRERDAYIERARAKKAAAGFR